MKNILKVMLIAAIGFTLWGCGGGSSSTTPSGPSAADYTAEGWIHFEASEYDDALTSFTNALDKDSDYYEAVLGRGLIYLADPVRYSESTADSWLMSIYTHRASVATDILIDAYAAMCGYKVKNNANLSLVKGFETTLSSMSTGWAFSHNNSELDINWAMTRLNQAELYFYGSSASGDHTSARTFLNMVLNYGGYASLAQDIRDKAQALNAQFTAAGI